MDKVKRFSLAAAFAAFAFIATAAGSYAAQEYVIGEEDVLQISVWGTPELTVTVPVKPDGKISMHLVGDITAAGLTPSGLKAVLEKDLSKFLRDPNVSVIVTDVQSFKVFVLGEGVAAQATPDKPLVFTFKRSTTLAQLLAHLGTLRNADLRGAYVMRDGKKLVTDFRRLVGSGGDSTLDVQLKPNDVVFIPDSFESRIMVIGAVKTPNVQQYREGMTAMDAVLGAGGFNEYASQNDVMIVRREEGKTRNIQARLKDVQSDGDLSKDIPLMPGDHIIVKTGIF